MNAGGRTFAGRYALDVQVSTAVGTPVWRALDQSLRRWVTLYLMPRTDPRSPAVITSCLRVSANSSRNSIAILDVIEAGHIEGIPTISPAADYLGIVTEWVEGESLDRALAKNGEPFDTVRAWDTIEKLAKALDQAHALNITHSRLRPHNVIFSDSGEVRIAGFGIESAILGPDRTNGVQADIIGLGNLLFAMTTGSWPNEPVDGLPAAISHAAVPEPSSVTAGIPARVDRFFVGTQDGSYLSVREALAAMSIEASGASSRPSTPRPATARPSTVFVPPASAPEPVAAPAPERPSARERLKKLVPPALQGIASTIALGAPAASGPGVVTPTVTETGSAAADSAASSAPQVVPSAAPRVRGSRIAGREVPPSDPPREAAQEIVSSWFEPISQPTAATEAPAGEEFGSAARRATTPSPAPAESEPAARTADVNIASGDALHLAAAADSGDESSATGTANQTTSPAAPSAPATDSSSIETDIEQVVDSDAQESPSQTWLAAEHIVSEAPSQAQTSPSNDTPAGYTPPVDPAPIATVPSNVVNPEPVAAHRPAKPSRLPRLARIPNNPVTGARVTGQAAVASSRLAEIASVDRLTSHPPVDYATNPEDPPTRNRMTAIALGAVVIFGWVGWQLLTSSFQSSSEVPTAIVVTPMTSLPAPSPTPSGPTSIAITSAVPFDPFGDNTENEAESAAAIDGDAQTVWHTVVYKAGNLGGKPGVGLLLDLGSKQKITTVDLTFEAAGLDATIYVSKSATPDVKTDKVLGTITNSNNTETVTADKAIKGQYVLVWITGVPQTASGGYQGGVAEVTVAGE